MHLTTMELLILGFGVAALLLWWIKMLPVLRMTLHPRSITRVTPAPWVSSAAAPRVSVLVPACNEGPNIERCLRTLLAQDYANLEIVAIDDRSTDETGPLMDRLAVGEPRLKVIHITELPPGWLGKNHANHVGAASAVGEWLLFTDGDIFFDPTTISRALTHVVDENLDHLTLFPGLIAHGPAEKAACCLFGLMFSAKLKPWQVRDPLVPDAFCGIGAFNLVRRAAYEAVGGHERLRLEVGDDVKLGKLFKMNGKISDLLAGWPMVEVRWQVGLLGVIRGLEKNAFAAAEFHAGKMILGNILLSAMALLPVLGTLLAPGGLRIVYAALFMSQVTSLGLAARQQGFSFWIGLYFPIACLALSIAAMRSMILTLYRGGIRWRGTFYSLEELKKGIV
jgi:glycosyltransferase involved in cell wall biosynthesis